ncbi:zinc finger protein 276 isoform X1 [Carcharodon carcharias]|uniref:zinc finger protein 276 isoform X1 n=2 Tax=Carcharodon carcharias TaxID=13397 RepID=UPI001B7EF7AD|nr:zinc finger protein 276 isoform X1 [Carcharodon carcharias]
MKRNKRGRFVSVAMAQKMERLSEAQQQRWVRTERPGPEAGAPPGGAEAPEPGLESATPLVVTTSYCRLCHGKFSSRSLRNAFAKVPLVEANPEMQRRAQQTFGADFQKLVGVVVRQDPTLPQYICRNCHAQFYKCRSILRNYIQRVNTSPVASVQRGQESSRCVAATKSSSMQSLSQSPLDNSISDDFKRMLNDGSVSASPQCLQVLVTWAHHHGSSCGSPPNVQSVLSAAYCGVVGAVWGCPEGHSYILDVHPNHNIALSEGQYPYNKNNDSKKEEIVGSALPLPPHNGTGTENGEGSSIAKLQPVPVSLWSSDSQPCTHSGGTSQPADVDNTECLLSKDMFLLIDPDSTECSWGKGQSQDAMRALNSKVDQINCNKASCSVKDDIADGLESSDLSDRYLSSEDDGEEKVKNGSSDESFQPYWEKNKVPTKKCDSKDVKKTPGQKRGRKPKSNSEREDFPTMYRCQYKGCCAIYRGADGLKKHIKEHHEEVRERPCPHPGCNKVFLIDRYLQRHVKLIHTEERNYICDECGQTFKQRKHLSVHQMRHSGAKPLQCEICGFQCRQRASLKYHMTKHKAEAELDFACDQCGKRFEKAHNLNVHMSMVHPLTQNTDKSKPAECVETEPNQLSTETFIEWEPS